MTLLAVRLIDLAIFGSLGGLWIGGAIFIVVLYRWILRFEAGQGPTDSERPEPVETTRTAKAKEESVRSAMVLPQTATAREALASHS